MWRSRENIWILAFTVKGTLIPNKLKDGEIPNVGSSDNWAAKKDDTSTMWTLDISQRAPLSVKQGNVHMAEEIVYLLILQ